MAEELQDYVVSGTLPPKPPEQRESTAEDYWNTVNPIGLQYNNPQLSYTAISDDSRILDTSDPSFLEAYNAADAEGKEALLGAKNNEHALMIAERRKIQKDSMMAIANDGLATQLLYGAVPALASPTSFIPVAGIAGKAFQVGKVVSKVNAISKVVAVGAISGAAGNLGDELIIGAQGMESQPLTATLIGATFGGTLGGIAGALSGPYAKTHAKAMSGEGDTFTKDFDVDPHIHTEVDENGIIKMTRVDQEFPDEVGRQKKNFVDYIPLIGKFLRSDVNTVYQSASSILRGEMSKLSGATVALRDADGNVIPTPWNAVNDLKQADGIYMHYNKKIEESYNQAVSEGYGGSYDDFMGEVSTSYTRAANKQEIKVYEEVELATKDVRDNLNAELKAKREELNKGQWYYKGEGNKDKPVTPEMIAEGGDDSKWFTKKAPKKELDKALKELDEEYRAKMDEEIRAKVDEIYEKNPVEFEGTKYQVDAAKQYQEYYKTMLERAQEFGVKELKGLSKNRLYRPRVWNFKGIKKMDPEAVKQTLTQAIASHPANKGLTAEGLKDAVDFVYKSLMNSTFDLNHLNTSWLVSKEIPFSKMLVQRKIRIDETQLGTLLKDNLQDTTGAYHYKIKGRQALAKNLGIVDKDSGNKYIQDLRDRLMEEGNKFTEDEFKAFERTIKDITGDLRMNTLADTPEWTWTRNLSTYNSLRLGGGFGGNQFIELVSNMVYNGISSLTSGRLRASFRNAGKLLYTKGKVDDQFTNAMVNSGFMETALHTHRVNRYADGESGFYSGWLENGINGLNDKLQKYNGMRYFTAAMEDHTGGMIMEQLKTLAKRKRLSKAEETRLARWGFSHEDAKAFAKDLDKYYSPKEGRLELDKFSPENQQKFQQAIQNGVSEMIVQGDSIHLPNWMKTPGPVLKLFSQFMRFPLIANEVLLRKGFQEEQAKWLSGLIGSTLTYMGLKYIREQAAIEMGMLHPMDAKYDYYGYDSDEAIMRGLMGSFNYNAQLGMMSNLWNLGANASGYSELGRDYANNGQIEAFLGPTFGGTAKDMLSLMRSAGQGEIGTERDMLKLKSALPMNNLPLIDEAFRAVIEEMQ